MAPHKTDYLALSQKQVMAHSPYDLNFPYWGNFGGMHSCCGYPSMSIDQPLLRKDRAENAKTQKNRRILRKSQYGGCSINHEPNRKKHFCVFYAKAGVNTKYYILILKIIRHCTTC
jgi:hypothetical protein